MKRHPVDQVLRWALKNWYRVCVATFIGYIAYTAHTFSEDFETVGQRFLDTTKYFHDKMEEHDAPLGDLPSLRPQTAG